MLQTEHYDVVACTIKSKLWVVLFLPGYSRVRPGAALPAAKKRILQEHEIQIHRRARTGETLRGSFIISIWTLGGRRESGLRGKAVTDLQSALAEVAAASRLKGQFTCSLNTTLVQYTFLFIVKTELGTSQMNKIKS